MSFANVYVFVRTDIPIEQQMVQALHAVYGMAALWVPEEVGKQAPNMILLGLPNVAALRRALAKLQMSGLGHYSWVEPDNDYGLTAVCTVPLRAEECQVLKKYKLWSLREQTVVRQSGAVVTEKSKSACGELVNSEPVAPLNTGVAQHTEHSVLTERLEAQTLPPVPISHEQQSRCCE